ncbi:MAG: bifunctional ornithine acetyltransferase/N-acetylglutamate synthase, partial [Candidatus Omnitrophota bacterium]|nr:bifunctional ornithine acetyltransferase/N-acetylglutamate synthase [Candidatus Omnitrophota bacterium]
MIVIKGGITAAKGFLANGVKAGIKKSGRKDLALLYSEAPAVAAGAFTTNRFQASPIKVSKLHLKNKTHRAIIINSGNANCAAGRSGDRNAVLMTEYAAKAL